MAERYVLGCMMLDDRSLSIGFSYLTEDDFVDIKNQNVFRAISELYRRGAKVEYGTVCSELQTMKLDEETGGLGYVFQLTQDVTATSSAEHYIRIVKDQSVLRQFLLTLQKVQKDYMDGEISSVGEFLDNANAEISDVIKNRSVAEFKSAADVAKVVANEMERAKKTGKNGVTGVDTGYPKLNMLTHGWQPETLIIVAARPSVGKTSLALNFAYQAAKREKKTVGFFSLEMSAEQVMQRLLSLCASVDGGKIQTGMLNRDETIKVAGALKEISDLKLYIDDTPNALLGDIIAKATKLKSQHPDLCLLVVDYLGLIQTGQRQNKDYSRQAEISEISSQLKALARSLQIPIILVCQVNRHADDNSGGRPKLSNLAESGSVEQNADVVLLLYRKDYVDNVLRKKRSSFRPQGGPEPEPEPEAPKAPNIGNVSETEVHVAKNRQGSTDYVNLLFFKAYSRFDTPIPEVDAQMTRNRQNESDD